MILKELVLGNKINCTCSECGGTGLFVGILEENGLAVICNNCRGKGYNEITFPKDSYFLQAPNGKYYYAIGGDIIDRVDIFDELVYRDDVKYVMFGTLKKLSPEYLFENGVSSNEVITYEEFFFRKLPLPAEKYTCPAQFMRYYSREDYDCKGNDLFSQCNCEKYGQDSCWEEFYDGAENVFQKRNVLSRKLK